MEGKIQISLNGRAEPEHLTREVSAAQGFASGSRPTAQTQLSWVRSWKTRPPLLPTVRGSRASAGATRTLRGWKRMENATPSSAGTSWRETRAEKRQKLWPEAGQRLQRHPGAPTSARLPGQALAPAPLLGLEAWPWILLCSQPSMGTQALCAWSSVPAYSTHLLLSHLPA